MQRRWNYSAECKKPAAQRRIQAIHKVAERSDQPVSYKMLKSDHDAGVEEKKASIERQKILESQIKSLQDEVRLNQHCSDLKEQAITLWRDIEDEKTAPRVDCLSGRD
jgi:predicted nuclease with TOPRIM domain